MWIFGWSRWIYVGSEIATKIYDVRRHSNQDFFEPISLPVSFFKNMSFLSSANAAPQMDVKNNSSNKPAKRIIQPKENTSPTTSLALKSVSTPKPLKQQITHDIANQKLTVQKYTQRNVPLENIYKNTNSAIQVSQILNEIRTSYQHIHNLKLMQEQEQKEEIAHNNFDIMMKGFNLINTVGRETGNKTIERIGVCGLSLVQGAFGVAQLTGAFGVTQVVGFGAMINPIATIAMSALSLGSMLFSRNKSGKKQSKAMQEMFRALSHQIMQIHRDMSLMNNNMLNGFKSVLAGLDTINKNINSVHDAMANHFSNTTKQLTILADLFNQQYESLTSRIINGVEVILENQINLFEMVERDILALEFKIDNQNLFLNHMDEKLNKILSDLQALGFKDEISTRNKMHLLAEQFQLLNESENASNNANLVLCKLLQSIRSQLLLANSSLKSLDIRNNSFSGWYHLGALSPLFLDPDFHNFCFDYGSTTNLQWSQSTYDCFFNLWLSDQNLDDPRIHQLKNQIINLINRTTKATNHVIKTLASESFLKTFFLYYKKKIDAIDERVEKILSPLRKLNQTAMREYAQSILKDAHQSDHKPALLQLVQANTKSMSAQVSLYMQEELVALTKEYNDCISNFKKQTNIVFSLLEISADNIKGIKTKLNSLKPIPELSYRFRGITKIKRDATLPENTVYSFAEIDTNNYFNSIEVTWKDLSPILEDAKDYAAMSSSYLDLVNCTLKIDETDDIELLYMSEPFLLQPIEFKPHEEKMRSTLNPKTMDTKTIDELIQLMKPVLEIAQQAKHKTIYYVMGITGDGKSTLLNCLNGTRYEEEDDLGDTIPKKIEDGTAEVCKVGTNMAVSETLFPQLVEIVYGDKTITYCDLPGLDGSRSEAVTYCEAFAPMILNEQVANVGGILWVLSADQFKSTKAEKIKEILQNLLKISNANPQLLAESMTLVITKGSEKLKKEHIVVKIKKIIEGMTNSEEKEKKLLTEIWLQISKNESKQIVITQILDQNSKYLDEIQQLVISHKPINKNELDFSAYCSAQENFKEKLNVAMTQYQSLISNYNKMSKQVTEYEIIFDLETKTQNGLLNQKEQLVISHRHNLCQLEEKQQAIQLIKEKIIAIESQKNPVKVGAIKESIKPLTRQREIDVPTGEVVLSESGRFKSIDRIESKLQGYHQRVADQVTFPKSGRYKPVFNQTRLMDWINQKQAQGYTVILQTNGARKRYLAMKYVDDKNNPIYKNVTVTDKIPIMLEVPTTRKETRVEPIPLGNPVEYIIRFPSSTPVDINLKNNNQGWKINPGSEIKQHGYEAKITYEKGIGCEIDLDVCVSYKDSEEGRLELRSLHLEKNRLDQELLLLTHQGADLEIQIEKNNKATSSLDTQLSTLEKQKVLLENELKEFTAYMTSKEHDFESLNTLNNILNRNSSIQTGITHTNNNDKKQNKASEKTNIRPSILSFSQHGGMFSSIKSLVGKTHSPNTNILKNIRGLSYQPLPGDGHCLYNAVALYLGKDQTQLRKEVADFIEAHIDDFKDFIVLLEDQTLASYIKSIRDEAEWASNIEIEALMRVLNRPIVAIGPDGNILNHNVFEKFTKDPIFVYYNGHDHYDGLCYTNECSTFDILQQFPNYVAPQQVTKYSM